MLLFHLHAEKDRYRKRERHRGIDEGVGISPKRISTFLIERGADPNMQCDFGEEGDSDGHAWQDFDGSEYGDEYMSFKAQDRFSLRKADGGWAHGCHAMKVHKLRVGSQRSS